MGMNTSGMGTLIISVYKKYGVVPFQGAAQLCKIISRNKTLRMVPQCDTIRGCGTNAVYGIMFLKKKFYTDFLYKAYFAELCGVFTNSMIQN